MLELCLNSFFFDSNVNSRNTLDIAGVSATALKGESWATSHVELEIPLMIAGVVIPTGKRTASVLQTVELVLAEMPLVVVMDASMLSLILMMMIPLTPDPALCAMLSSRMSPSGLCSNVTW